MPDLEGVVQAEDVGESWKGRRTGIWEDGERMDGKWAVFFPDLLRKAPRQGQAINRPVRFKEERADGRHERGGARTRLPRMSNVDLGRAFACSSPFRW